MLCVSLVSRASFLCAKPRRLQNRPRLLPSPFHADRTRGFHEVVTPNIFNLDLWRISGHADHYLENMFTFDIEGQGFGLKPMNCPGHCLMFDHRVRSYRELPLRLADFGVLHRNEFSGALTGLTRVRRFQQDDAHIFCRPDQIKEEVAGALKFMQDVYGVFGFRFDLDLSTRPAKALGLLETWTRAEAAMAESLNEFGLPWKLNPGDGAFYGPKIDIKVYDALGRRHQCATIQLDFQLPIRFNLRYKARSAADAAADAAAQEGGGIDGAGDGEEGEGVAKPVATAAVSAPSPEEAAAAKEEAAAARAAKKADAKAEAKARAKAGEGGKNAGGSKPAPSAPAADDAAAGASADVAPAHNAGASGSATSNMAALVERARSGVDDLPEGFERPVIIHRAILGSVERFAAVLVEHTGGKWPLWLSPRQVSVVPVALKYLDYAGVVARALLVDGFYVDVDASTNTLNKKIREAQLEQYNYILVVGAEEEAAGTVNVRTRANERVGVVSLKDFVDKVKAEVAVHL